MGETTRYLMVYEEGAIGGVTEEEVRRVVEAAGGQLLAWHPAIGTALAASQNTGFSPNAVAQVRRSGITAPQLSRWRQNTSIPACGHLALTSSIGSAGLRP